MRPDIYARMLASTTAQQANWSPVATKSMFAAGDSVRHTVSETPPEAAAAGDALVLLRGVSKRFERKRKTIHAVRDLSLTLRAGEVLGLLGPNGSGKTTTIKMIAGLMTPDTGQVSLCGRDPQRDRGILGRLGAVLEGGRNVYWRLTPEENLEYFGVLKGLGVGESRRRGRELLRRVGLDDRRDAPVQQLSRGMQQKVALAVALIHRPAVLLLDEPTLGLDIESGLEISAMIRELAAQGHAILLTTHQMDVAQRLADRVAFINAGCLVLEERVATLLRGRREDRYRILIEGTPDPACLDMLATVGAQLVEGAVIYSGSPEGLYHVLALLKPLPLAGIARDSSDLTQVFLRITREHAGA